MGLLLRSGFSLAHLPYRPNWWSVVETVVLLESFPLSTEQHWSSGRVTAGFASLTKVVLPWLFRLAWNYLSQSSADNSLDVMALSVLWHALSAMGSYLDSCVPVEIMSKNSVYHLWCLFVQPPSQSRPSVCPIFHWIKECCFLWPESHSGPFWQTPKPWSKSWLRAQWWLWQSSRVALHMPVTEALLPQLLRYLVDILSLSPLRWNYHRKLLLVVISNINITCVFCLVFKKTFLHIIQLFPLLVWHRDAALIRPLKPSLWYWALLTCYSSLVSLQLLWSALLVAWCTLVLMTVCWYCSIDIVRH